MPDDIPSLQYKLELRESDVSPDENLFVDIKC